MGQIINRMIMEDRQMPDQALNRFYLFVGRSAGWISAGAFVLAAVGKIANKEWLFPPSDLFQAALYLVLFAIFATLASAGTR